jgi:uncharacterized protein
VLPYKFEILQESPDQFRWQMRSSNGGVMCSSRTYTTKASAKKGIEAMQAKVGEAIVEDTFAQSSG